MFTKSPPAGYHTVTPALVVRDAAAAIAFYERAFGARDLGRFLGPDGKVAHAELQIGDSRVMLGEENPAWGSRSPLSTNGVPASLHLYVDDADAAVARAVEAGAKVKQPLEDAFWGDRYGKVTDPFGHEWGLAHRVRDMTPEEMQQAGEAWMAQFAERASAQQGSGAPA